jgi:hypothetical protein
MWVSSRLELNGDVIVIVGQGHEGMFPRPSGLGAAAKKQGRTPESSNPKHAGRASKQAPPLENGGLYKFRLIRKITSLAQDAV